MTIVAGAWVIIAVACSFDSIGEGAALCLSSADSVGGNDDDVRGTALGCCCAASFVAAVFVFDVVNFNGSDGGCVYRCAASGSSAIPAKGCAGRSRYARKPAKSSIATSSVRSRTSRCEGHRLR